MIQQRFPPVEIADMRLTSHGAPETFQVGLSHRTPPLQARPRQVRRQLTMQPPGAPLRAGESGPHLPPDNFKPVPHARQQPVELLVTRMDLSGEELADAWLPHPAEARQLRLGSARGEHDFAQHGAAVWHLQTIAYF